MHVHVFLIEQFLTFVYNRVWVNKGKAQSLVTHSQHVLQRRWRWLHSWPHQKWCGSELVNGNRIKMHDTRGRVNENTMAFIVRHPALMPT